MSETIIDQIIGIARPGDVVIMRLTRCANERMKSTVAALERMQARFPGVGFVVVNGDDMEVRIREPTHA